MNENYNKIIDFLFNNFKNQKLEDIYINQQRKIKDIYFINFTIYTKDKFPEKKRINIRLNELIMWDRNRKINKILKYE